jgi:hypothetical protein
MFCQSIRYVAKDARNRFPHDLLPSLDLITSETHDVSSYPIGTISVYRKDQHHYCDRGKQDGSVRLERDHLYGWYVFSL